jgi:Tol biopolymer transport system component
MITPSLVKAQYLADYKGGYDDATNAFYFDGRSYNAWTKYKEKYDETAIYEYSFKTEKLKKYYATSNKISSFTMSPDAKLLSFIEDTSQGKELIVINRDGQIVSKIDSNVQKYEWGSESNKLYFITGSIEKGPETSKLIPDGVWAYNLNAKEKIKIAEKGWNIRSVIFDSNIYYFNGEKNVRYNVIIKAVEDNNLVNTNLTPNKKYYYYYLNIEDSAAFEPPYWSPFRIYDTSQKNDLPADKIGFISEREPGDIIWAKDSKTIIFRGNKQKGVYSQEIFVYNLENNQLVRQFTGIIVGINNKRTKLVVLRDGKFFVESIPVAKLRN